MIFGILSAAIKALLLWILLYGVLSQVFVVLHWDHVHLEPVVEHVTKEVPVPVVVKKIVKVPSTKKKKSSSRRAEEMKRKVELERQRVQIQERQQAIQEQRDLQMTLWLNDIQRVLQQQEQAKVDPSSLALLLHNLAAPASGAEDEAESSVSTSSVELSSQLQGLLEELHTTTNGGATSPTSLQQRLDTMMKEFQVILRNNATVSDWVALDQSWKEVQSTFADELEERKEAAAIAAADDNNQVIEDVSEENAMMGGGGGACAAVFDDDVKDDDDWARPSHVQSLLPKTQVWFQTKLQQYKRLLSSQGDDDALTSFVMTELLGNEQAQLNEFRQELSKAVSTALLDVDVQALKEEIAASTATVVATEPAEAKQQQKTSTEEDDPVCIETDALGIMLEEALELSKSSNTPAITTARRINAKLIQHVKQLDPTETNFIMDAPLTSNSKDRTKKKQQQQQHATPFNLRRDVFEHALLRQVLIDGMDGILELTSGRVEWLDQLVDHLLMSSRSSTDAEDHEDESKTPGQVLYAEWLNTVGNLELPGKINTWLEGVRHKSKAGMLHQ